MIGGRPENAVMIGSWDEAHPNGRPIELWEWAHGACAIYRGDQPGIVIMPGERQALAVALYIDAAGEGTDD